MINNKDRIIIGSLALSGFLLLGIAFFFVGEPLLEFILIIVKYALYWIIGATIVLAILGIAYLTFGQSETAKELFDAIIMGKNFDE